MCESPRHTRTLHRYRIVVVTQLSLTIMHVEVINGYFACVLLGDRLHYIVWGKRIAMQWDSMLSLGGCYRGLFADSPRLLSL